jgi:hypothetical protein
MLKKITIIYCVLVLLLMSGIFKVWSTKATETDNLKPEISKNETINNNFSIDHLLDFLKAQVSTPNKLLETIGTNSGLKTKIKNKQNEDEENISVDKEQGRGMLRQIFLEIARLWKIILGIVAVVMIVIAGFRVTTSSEEETISTNKQVIVWVLIALVVTLMVDTIVTKIFFGEEYKPFVVDSGVSESGSPIFGEEENIEKATRTAREEILAVIGWFKRFIGVIAVVMIVLSGTRMILALGKEDLIKQEKVVFFWVGFGLIMLALNEVLVYAFYSKSQMEKGIAAPATEAEIIQGIAEFAAVITWLLTFLGIIALGAVVYGGFLLVINWGFEEGVEKAKNIITSAIIGLIVIFTSYAIVATMIGAES